MIIGTVRPEEARIHATYAGYHQFHSAPEGADATSESYRLAHGSFEIFWHAGKGPLGTANEDHEDNEDPSSPAGWYWWACFPGCMPDGEPSGPFATSRQALQDADEWHPEFDE